MLKINKHPPLVVRVPTRLDHFRSHVLRGAADSVRPVVHVLELLGEPKVGELHLSKPMAIANCQIFEDFSKPVMHLSALK